MNNEEVNLTDDTYSLHRILKTDIKKDPNVEEDEIIFGCGCSGVLKNVFGNFLGLSQRLLVMLEEKKTIQLIMKYVLA